MGLITLGIGGGATLAGLLLTGLAPSDVEGSPGGSPTPIRQVFLRRVDQAPEGHLCLDARATTTGFAGFAEIVIPVNGTFRSFTTGLTVAPGGGATRVITLVVNGAGTALSNTLSNATTTVTTTADVPVVVGDRVRIFGEVTAGVPASTEVRWSLEFTPDDETTSFYPTNIGNNTNGFVDLFTGAKSAAAENCRRLIPCDGSITSMVALNTFDSVSAPDALNLYLYKNGVKQDGTGGTVNTLLSHTDIAVNNEIVVSFDLPVVRGDDVYVGIEEAGTYPGSWLAVSMVFTPEVAGEHIMATMAGGTPNDTVPNASTLQGIAGGSQQWDSDIENQALICGLSDIYLGRLILECEHDPGFANTRTFELLKNGAYPTDGPAGEITTGALLIDDDRYATYSTADLVGPMLHTPDSTPTITGRVWFSLVISLSEPDPETTPVPPTPGGEAPPGPEPTVDSVPVGVTRVFVRLMYGTGSPYSERKFTETPFFFDPPEWYGGYGYPWLLSVGEISRELSDSLRGTEIAVRFADPERFFRTLATTTTLAGATLEVFLVSDTVRYALGVPHRRFAGKVHTHRALPNMEYELVVRDVLSEEMALLADAPIIPPARLTSELFPGMTSNYEGRAIPIALGEVSDEFANPPQGVVPPLIVSPSINLSTAFGGLNVDVVAAIVSHGALPPNGLWTGYYNTPDNPYIRIPIPDAAWGTILTAPGMPGWNYVGVAEDYVDYPQPPGDTTHRYTTVFFLASHPYVQAYLDGRIQIAFNVYGLTDEPDGSGLYFADAPDIYEFLLRNYLYAPHWRYGDYNTMPTLPDGYSIINHDSIVLTRNRLRGFLGSPGEYPVGFLLGRGGQPQTLRHVLQELAFGVLMEQGFDRHGRILLDVEDVDAEADLNLSDLLDITDGEFEVWVDRTAYRNNAEFFFGYRYVPAVAPLPTPPEGETLPAVNLGPHQDWQSMGAYAHAAAVAANQGKTTPPMQLENYVVRDSTVAVDWVQRQIARMVGPGPTYDGPRMFRLTTSWQALDVELGDVIAIDHIDGLGASGFEGQRGRVLKIVDDVQNARIVLEGRLLYGED